MSRIKNLKTNPEHVINMVEIVELFVPEKKSKYVETLMRIMKKTKNLEHYQREVTETYKKEFGIDAEAFSNFTPLQLMFIYRFIDTMFNYNDLKSFAKFCEYNERGLIEQSDLSRYTTFEEIMTATGIAEVKTLEKDLEKQIKVIYSDDEWIVLRPLTYHSSRKYGSSTKWCTTQENNPEYFIRYAKKGILLYMINKVTGLKVACFKSLDNNDPEFSFWNQVDTRIDSMESELPLFIMECIKEEVTENPVTNLSLLSEEDFKKQEELLYEQKKSYISEGEPMEMREEVMEQPMVDEGPTDMEVTGESALDMRVENRAYGELTVGDMRGGTAAYNTGFGVNGVWDVNGDIGMTRG
jgi:hypothetical protein